MVKTYEVLIIDSWNELFELLGEGDGITEYANPDFNDLDIQLVVEENCFYISGNDQHRVNMQIPCDSSDHVGELLKEVFRRVGVDVHLT